MRISYLKPPIGGILGLEMLTFVEPLGLECVAGAFEADGHQQQIIDLRLEDYEEGLAKCKNFNPDIVGMQCNFTTERYRTIKLWKEIKRLSLKLTKDREQTTSAVKRFAFMSRATETVISK